MGRPGWSDDAARHIAEAQKELAEASLLLAAIRREPVPIDTFVKHLQRTRSLCVAAFTDASPSEKNGEDA